MHSEGSGCRSLLIACSCVLVAYGLLILYSAAQPTTSAHRFAKQCYWLGVACLFFLVFSKINLLQLRAMGKWLGWITIGLLLLVFIPGFGRVVNGSRRWVGIGSVRMQPSELAKIGFVLFLSYWITKNKQVRQNFIEDFVRPLSIVGFFCLLLLLEPDFGTALLFGSVALLALFVRGMPLRFIVPAAGLVIGLFALLVYLNPVRFSRILSFLDLENTRMGTGYQLWQSLVAFSSGKWFGRGLGLGHQQFFFLPEVHTDFIGAVLAEELGIVHVFVVLGCFATIAFCGLKITWQQDHPFLFYTGLTSVCFLTLQAFINLGVITGLLPTKGMALPFLSYGGSNLVANFSLVGLLVNLSYRRYPPIEAGGS